jgi:hypothetical protein
MASTITWFHMMTPVWSIVPYHRSSTPVPLHTYCALIIQSFSHLQWLQHHSDGYFSDMAWKNTWRGSFTDDIGLSTINLAASFWFNGLSQIYACPSGLNTISRYWFFSSMNHQLSVSQCNTVITHNVLQILNPEPNLCHSIISKASAFKHNCYA